MVGREGGAVALPRARRAGYRTPLLFIHSLVSRSYVFDLVPGNSFVETMRRPRASTSTSSTGACPTSWRAATRSRPTPTATSRRSSPRCRGSPATPTSTCSATASAACCRCSSLAGNPDLPVRSLAVMATPTDFRHMGPMTSMMQEGRVEPERPPRRDRQRAGRRDAQLVQGARSRPATSSATSTCWQNLWNDEFVAAHQVDDAVGATTTSPSRAPRSARWATCCRARTCWRRARCRSAGARSTWPTSPSRSSTSSARRTTSCRPTRSARWPASSARPTSRSCGCRPATSALIVGRTAQRHNIPAMADWLARHSEPI